MLGYTFPPFSVTYWAAPEGPDEAATHQAHCPVCVREAAVERQAHAGQSDAPAAPRLEVGRVIAGLWGLIRLGVGIGVMMLLATWAPLSGGGWLDLLLLWGMLAGGRLSSR